MNVTSPSSRKILSNARTLLSMMAAYIVATSVFYLGIYFSYHAWQALVATGVLLVALIAVPVAYRLLQRGYVRQTGILLVVGLIFGYGVNELVWEGLLPFHFAGGDSIAIHDLQFTLTARLPAVVGLLPGLRWFFGLRQCMAPADACCPG